MDERHMKKVQTLVNADETLVLMEAINAYAKTVAAMSDSQEKYEKLQAITSLLQKLGNQLFTK